MPAFSGLYAPYWKDNARGVIAGLTRYATRAHIARAALEATAYQTRDVLTAMEQDSGIKLSELRVDGGMVVNELLMQFQADILDVAVVRPKVTETTALGAAYAAGLATGYWRNTDELRQNWGVAQRWTPAMKKEQRGQLVRGVAEGGHALVRLDRVDARGDSQGSARRLHREVLAGRREAWARCDCAHAQVPPGGARARLRQLQRARRGLRAERACFGDRVLDRLYPRWVSLFFAKGVGLPDPHKRLKGSGSVVRHVVLTEVAVLDDPQIRELMQQALARSGASLQAGKRGAIVIKSISARQRPRRPPTRSNCRSGFSPTTRSIMSDVNILAVLVAAVSSFLLGGLWYSPVLFHKVWNREAGRGENPEKMKHPGRVFGVAFVFALIAACVFACWLGPDPQLNDSLLKGLAVGAGFVGASFGINYQFANRSFLMWAIDAGYHTVQFVLFALVLSLWP